MKYLIAHGINYVKIQKLEQWKTVSMDNYNKILFCPFSELLMEMGETGWTHRIESMSDQKLNWELCCLCQSIKTEPLQRPKEDGIITLQRDLTDFSDMGSLPENINVTIDQLNDGSGIASTLTKMERSITNHVEAIIVAPAWKGYARSQQLVKRQALRN